MTQVQEPSADKALQQEQMLKLITKGFYRELMNYGIMKKDVISVSSFLLDYLMRDMKGSGGNGGDEYYNGQFTVGSVRDTWNDGRELSLQDVRIVPLEPQVYGQVATWLSEPSIRYSFIPPFPDSPQDLARYFEQPGRAYFTIYLDSTPVGIIGADNMDDDVRKLEMKKCIGATDMRGRGIGKHATFLFLYYAFMVRDFNKVYIHSGDTNIRNITLNSKFGFELEGIFFDDVVIKDSRKDVVRMSLFKPRWLEIFSGVK
jgi:RimJ/RimL family protein N-acetyltransferase